MTARVRENTEVFVLSEKYSRIGAGQRQHDVVIGARTGVYDRDDVVVGCS